MNTHAWLEYSVSKVAALLLFITLEILFITTLKIRKLHFRDSRFHCPRTPLNGSRLRARLSSPHSLPWHKSSALTLLLNTNVFNKCDAVCPRVLCAMLQVSCYKWKRRFINLCVCCLNQ